MAEPAPSPDTFRWRRGIYAALVILGVLGGWLLLRQLLVQELATDEATYAHGAWAVAQGQLPYRDFFFHHTPFLLQVGSLAFGFLGDDPRVVFTLRILVFLPTLLTYGLLWRLNRDWGGPGELGRLAAWAAPVLLLLLWPYTRHAVEIRPDNLALTLFLAALVVVPAQGRSGRPALRGFLAGVLVGAAVWASEKVLAYGSVFALGFALDSWRWWRSSRAQQERERFLLGHPLAFLGGFALVAAGVVVYLFSTGSTQAFWRWGVEWSVLHEEHYPPVSWRPAFRPVWADALWLLPLAALGWVVSFARLGRDALLRRDLLLSVLPLTAFLSFALQRGPHGYSLLPFLAATALLAARGLSWLMLRLRRWVRQPRYRVAGRLAVAGLALVFAASAILAHHRLVAQPTRNHQEEMLGTLARITASEDPVYDNTGWAVTRPHPSFFFFTDGAARELLAGRLSREIPEALVENGCTVAVQDGRFLRLPSALQDFFYRHFQPHDPSGRVWIWGKSFVRGQGGEEERIEGEFLAVRSGRWFVSPPEVLERGRLTVGGRLVTERIFRLERGPHGVVYEGSAPYVRILWLPRDGETFDPRPEWTGFFWPVRYRGFEGADNFRLLGGEAGSSE